MDTILEYRKRFWKLNSVDNDLEKEMKNIIHISLIYFRMFIGFVYVLSVLFTILPAVEGKHQLPMSTWLPEGYPYLYEITYLIQAYLGAMCCWFVIGFDVLFAAICIEITMQFRLLNGRLRSLVFIDAQDERLQKLKEYAQYHCFLIKYEIFAYFR